MTPREAYRAIERCELDRIERSREDCWCGDCLPLDDMRTHGAVS